MPNMLWLLSEALPVFVGENTGILRPERRLHIRRGALHVAEHEYPAPLRDRDADRQLPDRERDGFLMGGDGLLHLVIGALGLLFLGEPPVACRQYDLIFVEQWL